MSSYSKMVLRSMSKAPKPMITQCTAAMPRASLLHWKVRWAKWMCMPRASSQPHSTPTCSPCVMLLVETKAKRGWFPSARPAERAALTYHAATKSSSPALSMPSNTIATSARWPSFRNLAPTNGGLPMT